jgi:hypothetical protein
MGNASSVEELSVKKGEGAGSQPSSSSLLNTIKAASNKANEAWSDYDLPADAPSFSLESPEGQKTLDELLAAVPADLHAANPELLRWLCGACLRFRSGDRKTALERVLGYLEWRLEYIAPNLALPLRLSDMPEVSFNSSLC